MIAGLASPGLRKGKVKLAGFEALAGEAPRGPFAVVRDIGKDYKELAVDVAAVMKQHKDEVIRLRSKVFSLNSHGRQSYFS